jgi:hypothetical protein
VSSIPHESTKHEPRALHPRLARGGVLTLDDHGYWPGAMDEYSTTLAVRLHLNSIDDTGHLAAEPSRPGEGA